MPENEERRERCGNCKFADFAEDRSDKERPGQCRRWPPRRVSSGSSVPTLFPSVRADEWCGEWKTGEGMTAYIPPAE